MAAGRGCGAGSVDAGVVAAGRVGGIMCRRSINGVGGRLTFVRPAVLRGTTSPIEGAVGTGKWLWWKAMQLAMN